ncbi:MULTISPECIES: DUF1796 family putative cysteine peptidase [unclassified Paenibacillus]|uniref:DUF1796 family putative cysteine peptidase n=1 Tax=unclassified Paenibacillus TaxID=185978 RepID=UPI0036287226
MKWNDCVGRYKIYMSLGSTCQVAYQLNRIGLRQSAGPIDWFTSQSVPGLVQLLNHQFRGLMEYNNLELIDRTRECFVVRDNAYDVVSFHDFPLYLGRWWDAYPAFKEKVDRRVNRFRHTIQNKPVLFVRTDTSEKEAQQLKRALNTLMYGKFRLLIINNHPIRQLHEEEWGLDNVCCVNVPQGYDWKGSDNAWNRVMNGFTL